MSAQESGVVAFLLADRFGTTPRRCQFGEAVAIRGRPEIRAWRVRLHPPPDHFGGAEQWVVALVEAGTDLRTIDEQDVLAELVVSRGASTGGTIDPRDFDRFDVVNVVPPERVSRRAYPYACPEADRMLR